MPVATHPAALGDPDATWRLFACPDAAGRVTGRPIRVLLCHEAPAVRAGVRVVLDAAEDIEVVAAAAEGDEGVEATAALRPDIVLTDLCMPRVDGVATARRIGARAPDSHVLVLTGSAYPQHLRDAADAGAIGFVVKDATPCELRSAIRAAAGRA